MKTFPAASFLPPILPPFRSAEPSCSSLSYLVQLMLALESHLLWIQLCAYNNWKPGNTHGWISPYNHNRRCSGFTDLSPQGLPSGHTLSEALYRQRWVQHMPIKNQFSKDLPRIAKTLWPTPSTSSSLSNLPCRKQITGEEGMLI